MDKMCDNERLCAPMPDPGAYLARMGLNPDDYRRSLHPELPQSPSDYSAPHTKETLDTLVHAHLFNIPFENLDTYDRRMEVSLEIEDMFDKFVNRHRGGYCFELNAMFFALLQSLGFSCYPVAQRVLLHGPFPPLSHRAAIVTLPDGERIVCDVGFGGPAPLTAMYLDRTEVQKSGKRFYRFDKNGKDGLYRMVLLTDDGEMPLMMFSDEPFEVIDFILINSFMTYNKLSRFSRSRVVNLMREVGSVAIDNDTLRIHENGKLTERRLNTKDELRQALEEYFGIPQSSLDWM